MVARSALYLLLIVRREGYTCYSRFLLHRLQAWRLHWRHSKMYSCRKWKHSSHWCPPLAQRHLSCEHSWFSRRCSVASAMRSSCCRSAASGTLAGCAGVLAAGFDGICTTAAGWTGFRIGSGSDAAASFSTGQSSSHSEWFEKSDCHADFVWFSCWKRFIAGAASPRPSTTAILGTAVCGEIWVECAVHALVRTDVGWGSGRPAELHDEVDAARPIERMCKSSTATCIFHRTGRHIDSCAWCQHLMAHSEPMSLTSCGCMAFRTRRIADVGSISATAVHLL